jgi:hypothetical protein
MRVVNGKIIGANCHECVNFNESEDNQYGTCEVTKKEVSAMKDANDCPDLTQPNADGGR